MTAAASPLVGVLALQGAFKEHERALQAIGARTRLVRLPAELDDLDALVIPGGESTTMTILMERMGLWEPVRKALSEGLPALATCAGMIVLARDITDGVNGQHGFGLLDIAVRRNGYGRQVHSFEAPVRVEGLDHEFPGVFIRAPFVEDTGTADVYAVQDDQPVGVRQGRLTALCFHPELSGDLRLHREFVNAL
ncbi:MAG: pyridoxal 5'-phosphate synthase glutaminase subunit PdxT [Chloroflexi bacterium]|nr:MAG: pyridoxal 5'-phosphate synthase glutaminase subunit PdxT [Chloroflexota bacterium]